MFENIIGNDHVKDILKKSISSQNVPNTMLFQGPDGIGKSLFAKELAKGLIQGSDKKIDHESHPDYHVYLPGDSNIHSIKTMRNMIDEVYKPPYEGAAKVFVIHDADKMLESSANALLKTLEEPNLDSYIILLTSQPSELLPTIKSRCFKLNFNPIKTSKIIEHLESKCGKSGGLATYIAKMAAGSIGLAHLLASNEKVEHTLERLLDILKSQSIPMIDDIEGICAELDSNSDNLEMIFSSILMWFRDQMLYSMGVNLDGLFFKDDMPENPLKIPLENIHHYLDRAKEGIKRNIKHSTCLHNFFIEVYARS